MRFLLLLYITVLGIVSIQCGFIDESEKIVEPKYHTESDEGLWANKAATHVPIVTFKSRNVIEVIVPVKPVKNPIHYIEKIVLMNGEKEIASKSFSFSLDQPQATFVLPNVDKPNFKVVAKCNLHDMWMAPVKIPRSSSKK